MHPILAVRDLEPEMEAAFPIPDDRIVGAKKKRRVTHTARHMTSETMMQIVREKENKKPAKKSATKATCNAVESDQATTIAPQGTTNSKLNCMFICPHFSSLIVHDRVQKNATPLIFMFNYHLQQPVNLNV